MRILILGASGMLGNLLMHELTATTPYTIIGTVRRKQQLMSEYPSHLLPLLIDGVSADDFLTVRNAVMDSAPDIIINCIGLIRQLPEGREPLPCIEINARFPHLLLSLCKERHIRLIHYSTDCVFDGSKGSPYTEEDPPSAKDIYGMSKYLGEVREAPALTIRTSIIGHELRSHHGLIEWFLSQKGPVNGYTQAIYSGLPVTEHARVLRDVILPAPELTGLYQVAGKPISKYTLLSLVGKIYGKSTSVIPVGGFGENKAMSGDAFRRATGYAPPDWEQLIYDMYRSHHQRMKESHSHETVSK